MYNHRSKTVTQKDIAARLNLSKVSISKALRDHPDISQVTKDLVKSAALEMGYTPNVLARNLAEGRSRTIGVVVPKIAHNFFSTSIESIYDVAYERGYDVILTVSQENHENEIKHLQTLLSMRVDGILISVSEQSKKAKIFDMIRDKNVPLVFFDREVAGLGFSSVTCDDEGGAYLATQHLFERGYKRIAHIAGYSTMNIGAKRLKGYRRAMSDAGIQVSPNWVAEGGFSEKDGYAGFKKIASRGPLPEAIFTVTYPVALGVQAAAKEMGLNVPGDIDVICFGSNEVSQFVNLNISYIHQPAEELGRQAANILFQEMQNPDAPQVQRLVLDTELVPCDSCSDLTQDGKKEMKTGETEYSGESIHS